MIPLVLKRKLLRFAQLRAPIDTGNLRHNAIKGKFWNDKNNFVINYSDTDANYIGYLEETTYKNKDKTKQNIHKGFILATYIDMKKEIEDYYYRGVKMSRKRNFKKSEIETNYRREVVHNKSLAMAKINREVNNNGN
jgi:hypothetical protein